jgi:peptide deformylase
MMLPIVTYGHPILRKKGSRVSDFTPELRQLVEDMIETMHAAKGVGLAAQQVGKALQLAVIDVRGVDDRPSTLHLAGQQADVGAFMPVVLINPEITPLAPPQEGPEGCLSFPEIYNDVSRPESIKVKTLNQNNKIVEFQCGGLLSRAIQHEVDHLNGILFIDRMTREKKDQIRPELEELQAKTKACLK